MSSPSLKVYSNESHPQEDKNKKLNTHPSTQQSHYLSVQLKKKNLTQEVYVWDTKSPLFIGSPLKWSIEIIHHNKVLIRNLRNTSDNLQSEQHTLLEFNPNLQSPQEYPLPGSKDLTLTLKTKNQLQPAFYHHKTENKSILGFEVFTLFGNIIQKSDPFYETYNLYNKGNKVAQLKKISENNLEITNGKKELTLEFDNNTLKLSPEEKKIIQFNEIQSLTINELHWSWKISPLYSDHSSFPFTSLQHSSGSTHLEEKKFLKKYSIIFSSIFAIALLTIFLAPTPKESDKIEEIPAQFAKIILQPKKVQSEINSQKEDRARPAQAQNKQQATQNQVAIQKAFRNKAVQNNLNKLIKGGMNRMLNESKILTTTQSNLATGALYAAPAPTIGNSLLEQVENSGLLSVAAIGGEHGSAGGGAGYGTGTSAQVSGQGTGFVDLDFGNAKISQGLTADEVGKVIHKHLREVQYCYESSMMRNPSVEGKMTLDFNIGTNGKVNRANVKNSNLNDARLEDCIIKRLVTWPFPRPKGNVEVAISYPFILKALGR